jgi:hypothetical protein
LQKTLRRKKEEMPVVFNSDEIFSQVFSLCTFVAFPPPMDVYEIESEN